MQRDRAIKISSNGNGVLKNKTLDIGLLKRSQHTLYLRGFCNPAAIVYTEVAKRQAGRNFTKRAFKLSRMQTHSGLGKSQVKILQATKQVDHCMAMDHSWNRRITLK
jgi:hypothetical protein